MALGKCECRSNSHDSLVEVLGGNSVWGGRVTVSEAAAENPGWYLVVAGYSFVFYVLFRTLKAGLGWGVAFGFWTVAGAALTAVLGLAVYGGPMTAAKSVGTLLVEIGVCSAPHSRPRKRSTDCLAASDRRCRL